MAIRCGNGRMVHTRSKVQRNTVKKLVVPSVIIGATGGIIYIIDNTLYSSLLTRSIRAIYILLWIAYQYGYNIQNYASIEELHEIASESLLQLLLENKGLYIKIGQAIANQGELFPIAYQKRFQRLYDNAPFDDWYKINSTLSKNLGVNYETLKFESIDHNPIASASIAQVHKAKLKNGDSVALKVQHHYIKNQIVVDLYVYKLITKVYEKVFDLPLSMLTEYVSQQLQKETDFEHEMSNSIKMSDIIASDPDLNNIKIPKNYPSLTTSQVLTAEWIDGISLVNKQDLINNGYDIKLMMNQYINLFNKQIFKYGFIHSDPHPANLKVNRNSKGKQQLVLLDHGLYIQLTPGFRLQYCQLWKEIFSLNTNGISKIGRSWGINSIDLFATLISMRPINIKNGDIKSDTRDISDLLKNFISDESKFPRELPFLARTMRMIQNLNQTMGSPVNRINLLTNEAINCLFNQKLLSWFDYFDLIKIKMNLVISNLVFYLIRFKQFIYKDKKNVKGLEDYIELYMANTAKSIGINWI
ncbi:unnamed protein product [Candida verbasci]|uniref:ABC1 atypical kinase-like domain-containing protein n=1 Tax=Candida verbasci TaxID=1227364 RepID=A0A9W4TZE8_9ASCO|nr:unnamed protein product [Candida verbasci]